MTSPATLRVQRPSLPNDPIPPAQTRGPSQAAPDQAKTWLRSPSSPHEHAVVHADRPNKKTSGMHRIAKQSATILVYMAHNDSGHGLLQQPLPPPPDSHHVKPLARKDNLRHRLGPISGFPPQPIPQLHPAELAFRITNDKHDGESLLHPVPDIAGHSRTRRF